MNERDYQRKVRRKQIYSRRDFLRAGALATGAVALTLMEAQRQSRIDPLLKIETDPDPELSFTELSEMARRFDRAADKLKVIEYPPNTQQTMYEIAMEVLPMANYEGFVPQTQLPEEITFAFFPDGESANHVLGRSNCNSYAVINARLALDTSTWNKDELVFTEVHELMHVSQTEQICRQTSSQEIESSAQIGAVEVASALANQGNPIYLRAVVEELRGMFMSAAMAQAIKEGHPQDYKLLRSQLSPGAFSEARFAKSQRRWSSDPQALGEILYKYNYLPIQKIIKAIKQPGAEITGLAFQPDVYTATGGFTVFNTEPPPFKLDDTRYLFLELESLVNEAVDERKVLH